MLCSFQYIKVQTFDSQKGSYKHCLALLVTMTEMAYVNYLELTFSIRSYFKGFYDNSKQQQQQKQYLAVAKFAKRQNTEYPLICCTSAVRLLLGRLLCVAAQVPMTRDLFFSYLLVLSLNTYFSFTIRNKQSARFILFLKSLDKAFGDCLSQALLPSPGASYI